MSIPTQIVVRVIAKYGKFLGDDIGGALVTIKDAHTGELLATGRTHGGSGGASLMTELLPRSQSLPTQGASAFRASLDLEAPRLISVTAYGPLAAQQSANTVSATQWIYPGKDISGGDGFLLEIPGLVVQILEPPTHFLPASLAGLKPPNTISIRANVTMMCGCPIGPKNYPWIPDDYEVTAVIRTGGEVVADLGLQFDANAPGEAPSQFIGSWMPPGNTSSSPEFYEMTVFAYQQKTGNTGVDRATFIVPPSQP